MISRLALCCGVMEISGLRELSTDEVQVPRTPSDLLKELFLDGNFFYRSPATEYTRLCRAFVMFTGAATKKGFVDYTEAFKKFIEENKLGVVKRYGPKRNPNTHRYVTIYIWELAPKNLLEWHRNNP